MDNKNLNDLFGKVNDEQNTNDIQLTKEENNPFSNLNLEDKSQTEESDVINPFKVEEQKEENPFSTPPKEDINQQEDNPFSNLNLEDKSQTKESDAINPFETEEQKEENPFSSPVIEETPSKNEIKQSKVTDNEQPKPLENMQGIPSIINPFFDQKIQLNEKQKYKIKDSLVLDKTPHFIVKIEKKKPTLLKSIVGVLSYALFIMLLLIGVVLLLYVADIKLKQYKGDYSTPTYNAYVVLTGSMLPTIKVEDVVVTKKRDASELEEGDVITFASSDERYYGTIITHRIIEKYYDSTTKKYTFKTQGDNNNIADSALVESDRIYGEVIMKIPKLGYLQVFLAQKGGWIIVIFLPCAIVVSFDIVKLAKGIAQKRKLNVSKV